MFLLSLSLSCMEEGSVFVIIIFIMHGGGQCLHIKNV